jgi:flagellar hook-associated protein 2
MGTISSGTGLISGLNIQDIVSKLIAIDSQPITQLKARVTETQGQQQAYMQLSALLLGTKAAIHSFVLPSSFQVKTATSSDTTVLNATADSTASAGQYSFTVKSLAASHQLISSGFSDIDQTAVGAGTLTFASAQARVDPKTSVSTLNGFSGIRRGMIRITDRSGASADVDLRSVTTVSDILDAINSKSGISVKAGTHGGSIVITDATGLSSGNLVVSDLSGGGAAASLGIAGTFASGQAQGSDLLRLTSNTRLAALNDGTGVRTDGLLADMRFELKGGEVVETNLSSNLRFTMNLSMLNSGRGVRADETGQRVIRVTNRTGKSAEIDLAAAQTVGDVSDAIKKAGLSVTVSLSGSKLVLTDSSGGKASNLRVEDVKGQAAADLGIVADTDQSGLTGQQIYSVDTVGDVMRAIQYAEGNQGYVTVALSADGKGITFTDNTTGLNDTLISAANGSLAAYDLGLVDSRDATQRAFSGSTFTSADVLGGLNTVTLKSLKGGAGVRTGVVDFTRANGEAFSLDFTGAKTLADVMDTINADGRLKAEVGVGGTDLQITDTSGSGTMSATGTLAEDLGLTAQDGKLVSGDLHRQFISENTQLSSLNNGKGINYGQIRVSDSKGNSATMTLNANVHKTVGDVIRDINRLFVQVHASINENGDGIKLVDEAGGALTMRVDDTRGGTAAAGLGIAASAESGQISASYSGKIEIGSGDTLSDVAQKINDAGIGIRAGIVNDGSGWAPYHLTLTSQTSGLAGRLAFHATSGTMGLDLMAEARDAVVVSGDPSSRNALVIASGSNSVKNAVQGLTLNLTRASDVPVTLDVSNDVESVVSGISSFVDAFNNFVDNVAEVTKYVPETDEKGVLLGDSTVLQIHQEVYSTMMGTVNDSKLEFTNVAQVGLTLIVQSGGKLQFDETKFREAFAENPDAVKDLFTRIVKDSEGNSQQIGIAGQLDSLLKRVTSTVDGTLTLRNKALQDQIDQYTQREADLQVRIDAKQQQLYNKFYAMETALAGLQSQQSSLTTLASMAASAAA